MNPDIEKELANRKEPTRFIIKGGKNPNNLCKAFEMMQELNKIEQPYEKDGKKKIIKHRVGLTTDSQLIIDIDNHDLIHETRLVNRLKELFPGEYLEVRTLNGFQIISKEKSKSSYEYKNLKVLRQDLPQEYNAITGLRNALEKFLQQFRDEYPNPPKNLFNEHLKDSGLINPVGEFDYLYNVLAAINGHASIRITEKKEGDKWVCI